MNETTASPELWTIGHGAIETAHLFELLALHSIQVLVDVRSTPYSKFVPQANREILEAAAKARNVSYVFMGDALGGKPPSEALTDRSGHSDYARISQAEPFVKGLDRLLEQASRQRVCILCSEEDPGRCHRANLVAASLVERGCQVFHIRHDGRAESHAEMELRKTGGQLTLF